ncbi:MAG: DUF484 family protein [Magnetococcales bacterium]|nr:DUF484 family protein [Magnetococcales bacterium]MBF0439954.1 DUF484 family protein [Magnetococcales bacterium]
MDTFAATPEQIFLWLKANPDFFVHYPDLLPSLLNAQGKVLSLEVGQLNTLRLRNEELSKKLHDVMERVRRNERIYRAFHQIQVQLITAQTPEDLLLIATKEPEQLFDIYRATVTISSREPRLLSLFGTPNAQKFMQDRLFTLDHKTLQATLRHSAQPVIRVGLEGTNRALFFGPETRNIRSEALVPLFSHPNAGPDGLIGSLNLGGQLPSRFLPSDSTDLLRDLADILGICLSRMASMD